jgi:hypothetical protein
MASGGNTWFKKLRAIDKRNGLAHSKGSFQRRSLASTLDADKDLGPKVPKLIEKVGAHYKPGRLKGGSGCKLNQATRDLIAARREGRAAFLRSL